jgi:hypothetical protein
MSGHLKAYITLGWTPLLGLEQDGERVVMKVVGWEGGTGTVPATGQYVGAAGFVGSAAAAINLRGSIIDVITEFPVTPVEGRIYIKVDP